MAQFNPDAATQAWLATLPAADHARAIAYTQGGHWLLLWGAVVGVVSAAIILRLGVLRRISGWASAKKPRPRRALFLCAIAFFALDWLIELPWTIYANWWREKGYGLTKQSFGGWISENIMSSIISIIVLGLLLLAVYALMRRTPRW